MSFLKRIGSMRKTSYSLSKRVESSPAYDNKSNIHCLVLLLDSTLLTSDIDKQSTGQVLLDRVLMHLGLHEKDYFGLAYKADGGVTRWLDATKSIVKQLKGHVPQFDFRVRFYVPDPSWLHEELSRYLFVLQIRKDILANRLPCSFESAATLGSYIIQAELKDYDPEEHPQGYVSQIKMFPAQTKDLEGRIAELHLGLQSRSATEMDVLFLSHARRLDFYGVELFPCLDPGGTQLGLGIASGGITVFQNMLILKVYSWSNITKITYKRKKFFLELREEAAVSYQMESCESCKQLWRNCIDYHSFFKLGLPPALREHHTFTARDTLSRSHTHRDRTNHLQQVGSVNIKRSPSLRDQATENTDALTENHELKTIKSDSGMIRKAMSLRTEKPRLLVRRRMDDNFNESDERPVSPESFFDDMMSGGEYTIPHLSPVHQDGRLSNGSLTFAVRSNSVGAGASTTATPTFHNGPVSHDVAGGDASRDVGGVPPVAAPMSNGATSHEVGGVALHHEVDRAPDEPSDWSTEEAARFNPADLLSEGMLSIRLDPDQMGRFGFNVKGGVDQKIPVMISKVSRDSPASWCSPPLQEGDQIVYINGRSVSECSHDQVISMIRQAALHLPPTPLTLLIKPCDLNRVNPIIKVEDTDHVGGAGADPGQQLRASLTELKESLITKKLLPEFDQLYRRMPGLSTQASKAAQNLVKNRYRDILPYDATRVLLQEGPDYINASYINVELSSKEEIIRYIVTQGPMQHTTKDFWQMVWEQNCTILVMLTEVTEDGKERCFQYWPEKVHTSVEHGKYHISTVAEEADSVSVTRTLKIKNAEKGEERKLLHMQYTDWPDNHEIPGSHSEFCRFVKEVHQLRQSAKEPPIIHCSAGAGRTGVFILLETALTKVEFLEPVRPLEVVRSMRNQRGMLLQTMAQYQFACECILKAYEEDYLEIDLPKGSSSDGPLPLH